MWERDSAVLINIFFMQLLDEKKLNKVDQLYSDFETPEKAGKL